MTVFLDTGPLVAYLNQDDPLHEQGEALLESIWRGRWGAAVGLDGVLAEGATLLRRRPGGQRLSESYVSLFFPPPSRPTPLRLVTSGERELRQAAALQLKHYDQGISFIDALLAVYAQESDGVIATFDRALSSIAPCIHAAE